MTTERFLTIKPSFLHEWLALPPKVAHQVQEKLALLSSDPSPDGKVKKQLKGYSGKVYRLRAGDWRVLYSMTPPHVSVLALRKRDESTYDEEVDEENLGGPVPLDFTPPEPTVAPTPREQSSRWLDAPAQSRKPLPEPVSSALLKRLRIPVAYHGALVGIDTEEDLLGCRGVPDSLLVRVIDALYPKPIEQVLDQPDLVANNVADLLRYKEGKLVGFLLCLDDEQQKYVSWGAGGAGPTLLKGGPGTGKSTVALHRCREMIRRGAKRVLFTTYTNALVAFSQQLLDGLLGPDSAAVTVRTADSLAKQIYTSKHGEPVMADAPTLRQALSAALNAVTWPGNKLQQRAASQAIEKLGKEYLLEEISRVIVSRGLTSLDEYKVAARPGRKVSLGATQRAAIWTVHEALMTELRQRKVIGWSSLRAEAASLVAQGQGPEPFDAVVIDEVQDLDPMALSMLVGLCSDVSKLFLTADANQTIYGSMFRWTDIHTSLKFQGRTGVLRANHRSTREIGEAAHSYLANGALEEDPIERKYVHQGPLPVIRAVSSMTDENELLARFLRAASRAHRQGIGACAVFCPTDKSGRRIASALTVSGVPASFTSGKDLDLAYSGVKVLTLASSKGLEFPVVALAGFLDAEYPLLTASISDEEREELLLRERRTMFVAMTRAMRALLVVVPTTTQSVLLRGFDPVLWNLSAEDISND